MYRRKIFYLASLLSVFILFGCLQPGGTGANISQGVDQAATGNGIAPPGEVPSGRADFAALRGVVTLVELDSLPSDTMAYSPKNSYYVATDGSDSNEGIFQQPFATIGYALETAKDGDAVYVRNGTYRTGTLLVTQSNFLLAPYGNEHVILEPSGDNIAIKVDGNVHDVIVEGFDIEGFGSGIIYGAPGKQRNLIFRNMLMRNVGIGIENDYPEHTDYLVDGLLIKNITMMDITGMGINCGDEQNRCAKNVLVQNVRVYLAEGQPDETGFDSLAMVQSDNILVIDSLFANALGDSLDFKSSRVSVVNTVAANPNRNGVKFWHDGEIINSLIYGTGADAAVVFDPGTDGTKFRLINTVVAQHMIRTPSEERYSYAMTLGYDLPGKTDVEIKNSILYDMPGPIYINKESTVDISNNIFYGFIHEDGFIEYQDERIADIVELNSKGYAENNINADPKFMDPSAANFSIEAGSPAIDGGAGGPGIPGFDLRWKNRPQGSDTDIGPYESEAG